jgi:outer membrane receptor protein involved in Fe transport
MKSTAALLTGAMFLSFAASVRAQNRTLGEINGTVTDSTGARVPDAQVSLTNTLTGVDTRVKTDSEGVYDANTLVPGTYTVSISKSGFKTFLQPGVLLRAEAIGVNAVLEAGSVDQQVTVKAAATLLQTQSAEQRTDISSELVVQLPNVGESELNYEALIPGVAPAGIGGGSNGLNDNAWVSVNGTQANTQNWTMDGGTRTVPTQGLAGANVPTEAISQINYLTGNFGAEYGNGLAAFNVTTKSGTNQWHGSAYEYVQNNIFQARNHFSQPVAVPPYHWNLFGGTIGGPIKKNKVFFFFSYQHNPIFNQSAGYFSFPTAAMRNGDFSSLPVTVYDPNSLTLVNGQYTRTPLPGNKMDPALMNPIAKAIQSYLPLPNFPSANQSVCGSSGVLPAQCFANNLYFVGPNINRSSWYLERVDYDLSPTNHLDASTMLWRQYNPIYTNPGAPLNKHRTLNIYDIYGQISDFWTIRPNLVNEFRYAISRVSNYSGMSDYGLGYMDKIGMGGSVSPLFPYVSWSGFYSGSFNNEDDAWSVQTTFVPSDIVTWVTGKHVFKFGGEFDRYQYNKQDTNAESYSFSGIDTRNPAGASNSGLGYADFLYGAVSSFSTNTTPALGTRAWTGQLFAQDDYKARPNLTLNLGLRYMMLSGWSEVNNRIANYDPSLMNPATGGLGAMCYGESTAACPTVPLTHKGIVQPRVGFAWQPRTNWSVRGGYGIYYQENSSQTFGARTLGLGWSTTGQAQSTDSVHPPFNLSSAGPSAYYLFPSAANRQPSSQNGNTVQYNRYHQAFGYVQEWRLDVQRAVGQFLIDAAYVGSHGNDLPYTRSINQVPEDLLYHAATGANMQQYRPNPTFQAINTDLNDGSSLYDAFQFGLRKEFASGMSLILNYTYSRTMDDGTPTPAGAGVNVDAIQNEYDIGSLWSRSLSDTPNVISGGVVYPIPVGRGKTFLDRGGILDAIVGGWRASSVVMIHSGQPYTPLVGTANLSGALDGNWFPNRLGSGKLAAPTVSKWFDPSAFAVPSAGTFGDSGRTILRGPDMRQVDFSLAKSFALPFLGEAGAFQLKADATNVFNHTNLLNPNASIGTAGAGIISSAQGARNLQFGARMQF